MRLKAALGAAALIMALAVGANAQQPGAGSGRANGAAAFEEFREKHKYTFELVDLVQKLSEIEKDKKYALTQQQAKQVLATLKPLRSKPKLTQQQAKQALVDVKKALKAEQLNAMARLKPPTRPGARPGSASGTARPGEGQRSGPPPGGQGSRPPRRVMDPKAMQDFNPFYAKANSDDPRSAERAKRWDEFFSNLEKKANPPKAGSTAGKSTSKSTKK